MNALVIVAALLYIACLQLADEKGWPWLCSNVDRAAIKRTGLVKWEGDTCFIGHWEPAGEPHSFVVRAVYHRVEGDLQRVRW